MARLKTDELEFVGCDMAEVLNASQSRNYRSKADESAVADVFEVYSAGTETKPEINQDAVRIMKEMYSIDMKQTQYSK